VERGHASNWAEANGEVVHLARNPAEVAEFLATRMG
jgi:hypothetical protein